MNKSKFELLRTKQVAEELSQPLQFVQKIIREGRLKATKSGKEYLVTRQDLNKYLGIENVDEFLKKDLEIAQLKSKIKNYELQISTLKGVLGTLNNIVGLDISQ